MLFRRKEKKSDIGFDINSIPHNVAIIMDGNGRWAKKRSMPVSYGHSQGVKRVEDVVKVAIECGVKTISLYAFSTENWKRSSDEVDHLLGLIFKFYDSKAKELYKNGVKIQFPGRKDNVPNNVIEIFEKMESESKDYDVLTLNICFNYGSRQEITDSVNNFISTNPGERITPEIIQSNLYRGLQDDVDLLIRTSGEMRLSNFLLWQLSYSEFVFADELWPDFDQASFKKCLEIYSSRNRRFGGR